MFSKKVRLFLLLCCLFPATSNAQTTDSGPAFPPSRRFSLEWRIPMLQVVPRMPGRFSNLPLSVRTIPQHKDDTWFCCLGTPRIVPDRTVSSVLYSNLAVAVAPQVNFRRGILTFGTNFSGWQLPEAVRGSYWTTVEINQFGTSERGGGTSLVGTAIVARKRIYANPFVEWEFPIKKVPGRSILVGYAYTKIDISIRAFYDRYDSLETYKRYTISDSGLHELYVGAHTSRYFLCAIGLVYQQPHLTDVGRSMNTDLQRWSVMFTISPTFHTGLSRSK